MKILSFINPIKFGGGERLMVEFGDYFNRPEQKVSFVVANLNRSVEFEAELEEHGIRFKNFNDIYFKQTPRKSEYFVLLIRLLGNISAMRRFIKNENPDYVVANGFPSIVLIVLSLGFLGKKPRIIYMHHFLKAKENPLMGLIYRIFLGRYDLIVAVSSAVRATLAENFPGLASKMVFVPNGVDCRRFQINESKEFLREKLGMPKGVIAINAARLAAFKNQKALIDLSKELMDGAYILIAGEGDERKDLMDTIKLYGVEERVQLLGNIDSEKLPYYLKAADIFLFPSLKEGFSVAVVEAMAAGLPVVILKNIYADELGSDLFVANDINEFKNMAKELFSDEKLRRLTGENARKYAEKHLDVSVTGKRFLEVIS